MSNNVRYDVRAIVKSSTNGQTPWGLLTRINREITPVSPTLVCLDFAANAGTDDFSKQTAEAAIRRVRTQFPTATLILILFGRFEPWGAEVPGNETVLAWLRTLGAAYDAEIIDIANTMSTLMLADAAALTDWYTATDGVHPNEAGCVWIASQVETVLSAAVMGGDAAQWSGDLAGYPRVYDCAKWETTEINRNGIDNEGETGTWSTVSTTQRRSSEVGATISWTGTFSSFGWSGTGGTFEYQVDGGAWLAGTVALYSDLPQILKNDLSTAEHTVVFRVASGTLTVIRFIAV